MPFVLVVVPAHDGVPVQATVAPESSALVTESVTVPLIVPVLGTRLKSSGGAAPLVTVSGADCVP